MKFISAKYYLEMNPEQGHSFNVKPFDLEFYMIRKCICFGKDEQVILRVQHNINYIFTESCKYGHHNRVFDIYSSGISDKYEHLDEAVPLYPIWGTNFWHWVFESFPSVILLESRHYSGVYIVPNLPFILELLELFNIDKSRIKFSGPAYIIDKIILSEKNPGHGLVENLPIVELIRNVILNATGIMAGKKNIWVQRIKTRTFINNDEVFYVLKKYDFETMIPEKYSIKQQFYNMTNVNLSFMPHGANTTLTLAQPEYSMFVELFGYSYVNYTNIHIVKLLKLLYIPIPEKVESETINDMKTANIHNNILVNIPLLKTILQNLLSLTKRR
jgi:hypothetical protein